MMDWLSKKLLEPCDPSMLSLFRIGFGFLMMVDIPQERGMANADSRYGDDATSKCSFPLIHGMEPFNQDIMVLLYTILFINAFFIMIGFFYRLNCLLFTIIYWYLFILDKSSWNNHSYLYGLLTILLLATDANSFLSVDGLLSRKFRNPAVPHWNYLLFQIQVFIVYFYAGLKKTESDWLYGYSMHKLSREWVFDPLRIFLTNEQIDHWIVHICGFLYDCTVGFMLLFKRTRFLGLLLCGMFHGMNSMMFNIGMFPYVMFLSSFIFCHPASFKNCLSKIAIFRTYVCLEDAIPNPTCIQNVTNHDKQKAKLSWKQRTAITFTVFYICLQGFLPYSHFITKGYNGWTQGLYGYSWDMMVHSFKNQHVKITYENQKTGELGFLKPGAFLSGKRSRWTTQPEMAVQYARCIRDKLAEFEVEDAAVYFDVWKSMNARFQQRIFDPRIDLASYKWSPFQSPSFLMPVLSDLSHWREKLQEIKKTLRNITSDYDVVFIADFPGLVLENYVHEDLGNTTIEVLKGHVVIETQEGINISLKATEKNTIKSGEFHKVYTVSDTPSCYSYIYVNTTARRLRDQVDQFEKLLTSGNDVTSDVYAESYEPAVVELYWKEHRNKQLSKNGTFANALYRFVLKKLTIFRRSFLLSSLSMRNLLLGKPDSSEQLSREIEYLNAWERPRFSDQAVDVAKKDNNEDAKSVKTEL